MKPNPIIFPQIKLKIQNDKQSLFPDTFMMDWDNLSETELKRLVGQLEKTKNDVMLDLKDTQLHLDHEGKEFHHFDYFCQVPTFMGCACSMTK